MGSIDRQLCLTQIEAELDEELYINDFKSRTISPVGMVTDTKDFVVDIVCLIDLIGSIELIKLKGIEHDSLLWLDYESLQTKLHENQFSPISREIFQMIEV